MVIKCPPPSPDDCVFITPMQNTTAIAASTALPPRSKISRPMDEHSSLSAALKVNLIKKKTTITHEKN
jgi:hypothetical protein